MAHIFEVYLSPIPEASVQNRLAEALLKTCIAYGPIVCAEPNNYGARANIMWASSLALNGIIGKGKISDWLLHAIEHELSGLYDISHGVGLAVLLPAYMRVLLNEETVTNFVDYGMNVWGINADRDHYAIAHDAIENTRLFFESLGLPTKLSALNIPDEHFEHIAQTSINVRGSVGHYKQLKKDDVLKILNFAR